jgi:type IV secretion system protein TrbL
VGAAVTCNPLDPASCAAEIAADGLAAMAKSLAESASWAVQHMMTLWVNTPGPVVTTGPAVWVSDHLAGLVMFMAFGSVLFAAARMAVTGDMQHGVDLMHSFGRLILVGGLVGVCTAAAVQVGDLLADWFLTSSHLDMSALVAWPLVTTPPGVTLILAVVVLLAQAVQAGLMFVKSAMIVLLVGVMPLTAAATNVPLVKSSWQRALTWLLAFTLYKPVAALIYAAAFQLSSASSGIAASMSGVALMVLAIVALPALMRFLAPPVAAATGGNAGAVAGAVVGATIATGAVVVTGGASGAGFAGSAGSAMQAAPTGAAMGSAPGGAMDNGSEPPPQRDTQETR